MKTWSAMPVRQMQEHQKFPKRHTFDICVPKGSSAQRQSARRSKRLAVVFQYV